MEQGFYSTSLKVLMVIVLAAGGAVSQVGTPSKPASRSIAAPGNIRLPTEYRYEQRRGIDSVVGAIVRDDGFTINHDIGGMAGNYAYQYFPENFDRLRKQTHLNTDSIEQDIEWLQGKVAWRQRQKVIGEDVMVVMLKDSTLIASFPGSFANFTATADTSDKIAAFFLIVLTYQSKGEVQK